MQMFTNIFQYFGQAVAQCSPKGNFFGVFPAWYKYLPGELVRDELGVSQCIPRVTGLSSIWLIVAAVTDMLLRIAVLVAIGFVIAGGVKYISSQGTPDKTAKALDTIIKAVVGMIIALGSATILTYIVGRL